MPRFSIIIIATNEIQHTIACIKSIFESTKDFELIVVDNASTDGTTEYLSAMNLKHKSIKVIEVEKTLSFAENNNLGLQVAEGEFIVFLNNDTIVSKDWLEKMMLHLEHVPMKNIGGVGCVSNSSNGRQMVGEQDPEAWYTQHKGRWTQTGILYGWCMCFKKEVLDKIGNFDERFVNGHEDNDLSLRAVLAGYQLILAQDVYIHHHGQATLIKQNKDIADYMQQGYANRESYYDKYWNPGKKKLVAVYRTNGGKHLEKSLEQTSKFADSIILHMIRTKDKQFEDALGTCPCEQYVCHLKNIFPKIVKVGYYDGIFQEDYERNWLLQEALKLQEKGKANWCISIDDDEIYEDKFIKKSQKMMNPRNPETLTYWCTWRTIWETRMGKEFYRKDSTFGSFANYRFFRLIPGMEITSTHPEGHHCGSAPSLSPENQCYSNIRVKHLGYDTPEQRQKKFEFYQANDNFKSKADIGYDDYHHLISPNPVLEEYHADNGISLVMMVKDEERRILACLEQVQNTVDEYIIVDTGSTDRTVEIVKEFSEYCPVPVKLLHLPWCDQYSIPRNFGKRHATQRWILHLDADERFAQQDVQFLCTLSETDRDIYLFHVLNYMEKRAVTAGQLPKHASTESIRLYRNIPEFYYTGVLHETLDDALSALGRKRKVKAERPVFPLHHYGYLKEKKDVLKKFDYYEKLNLNQIEITEEKDPRPYFNLAMHYLNDKKEEKALKMFQRSLELAPRFWHASQQMAALNMKSAKVFLSNTINTIPSNHPFKGQAEKLLVFLNENTFGFCEVS